MRYDDAGLYLKFTGDACLTFWYNMRGKGAGAIEVIVDNEQQPVLELKGPKDTDWHKEQVEITGANKKVRVIPMTSENYEVPIIKRHGHVFFFKYSIQI